MTRRNGLTRPGGRAERVRKAVAAAVISMLRDREVDLPYHRLSELSGVHQSTIYRRWPDRYLLIQEAFLERTRQLHIPSCQPIGAYLFKLAKAFRDFSDDPLEIVLSGVLATSLDDDYNMFIRTTWTKAVEEFKGPIREAIEAGELPRQADPSMIITIIFGTISSEISFTKATPSDVFLKSMIEHIVGCAAAEHGSGS